jgi:antitoxin ParD1/3/4
MNVSLTPELEKIVRDKVESGLYNNASEVVREAIRRMHEDDGLSASKRREISERFDQALRAGMKEVEEGKTVPLTRELWDQIMAEGRALAASGAPLDPLVTGEF